MNLSYEPVSTHINEFISIRHISILTKRNDFALNWWHPCLTPHHQLAVRSPVQVNSTISLSSTPHHQLAVRSLVQVNSTIQSVKVKNCCLERFIHTVNTRLKTYLKWSGRTRKFSPSVEVSRPSGSTWVTNELTIQRFT